MSSLRVALVQAHLLWEQPAAQLKALEALLPAPGSADLVVLPETFATGFSMNPGQEVHQSMVQAWMSEQSRRLDAAVVGTIFSKNALGQTVNRCWWVSPDGRWFRYDKRHVFTYGGEQEVVTPGQQHVVVSYKGFSVALMVCYDLRFPVWSRRTPDFSYDILLYTANWPAQRSQAWKTLLPARAVENQSYVVAVNRVGADGHGREHSGDSGIWGPDGTPLVQATPFGQETFITSLSLEDLKDFRAKFPFDRDADAFSLLPNP
jgi:omega-amidase